MAPVWHTARGIELMSRRDRLRPAALKSELAGDRPFEKLPLFKPGVVAFPHKRQIFMLVTLMRVDVEMF